MLRLSVLCFTLLAGMFAVGCSSRAPERDYTLKITSTEDEVEYTLNGTIILDGVKTQVVEEKTPYRFAGKGSVIQATLTSRDLDCHLKGSIEASDLRDLTSTTVGPNGATVTVETTVSDRDLNMQIAVKPIKVKGVKPAEAKPAAEAAKPVEATPSAEITPVAPAVPATAAAAVPAAPAAAAAPQPAAEAPAEVAPAAPK